jgi:hypothetical protein
LLFSHLTAIYIGLVSGTLMPATLQTQPLPPDSYRPGTYFNPPNLPKPRVDKASTFMTVLTPPADPRQEPPISRRASEFNQPFLVTKKRVKKRNNEARWHIFRTWISADVTRLFVPNLQNLGQLNLDLHYGLKRSPYLLLHYEALTIKTKLKSNGMLQNEIYYNLGVKEARLGIKIRHRDPHLYFHYRF